MKKCGSKIQSKPAAPGRVGGSAGAACLPDGRVNLKFVKAAGGVSLGLPVRPRSPADILEIGISADRDFTSVGLGLSAAGMGSGRVVLLVMKKKSVFRISLRQFGKPAGGRNLSLSFSLLFEIGEKEERNLVLDSLRLAPGRRLKGRRVPASDRRIRFFGRLDDSDPSRVLIDWPATVKLSFSGPKIGVRMLDGRNDWYYRIDSGPVRLLRTGFEEFHVLATGLSGGGHLLELYKGTEAGMGLVRFEGFLLSPGGRPLEPPPDPERKMLFLGDSITSGGANVNPDLTSAPSRWKENGWLAFPAVVSRILGAQFQVLSRGGIGLWRNWNGTEKTARSTAKLPDYFDKSLFHQGTDPGELWDDDPRNWPKNIRTWDHRRWRPDAVVVFLGTNDCCTVDVGTGRRPVDRPAFVRAYQAFLDRIKTAFGSGVAIFCLSPLEDIRERNEARKDIEDLIRRRNDPSIVHCDAMTGRGFGMASAPVPWLSGRAKDYVGDRTHPHVAGHAKLAKALAFQIMRKMGWQNSPSAGRSTG